MESRALVNALWYTEWNKKTHIHMQTTQMKRKLFTEAKANESLVFVSAVAGDIVQKWSQILAMREDERGKHLEKLADTGGPDTMLDAKLLIEEIHYHTRELTNMGCYLKDLGKGIVLFPTEIRGEPTYLVWQLGDRFVRQTGLSSQTKAKV